MAGFAVQPELGKNFAGRLFPVPQDVIGVAAFPVRIGIRIMRVRVRQKVAFKCRHLFLAEQGGLRRAPQKPHGIHAILFLLRIMGGVIALPGQAVHPVQEGFAGKRLPVDVERPERTVLVHGDTAVIQQIAVVNQVDAAFGIKKADMLLQFFAVGEGKL